MAVESSQKVQQCIKGLPFRDGMPRCVRWLVGQSRQFVHVEIAREASRKVAAVQDVIRNLGGAHTLFEVDRVIAVNGGIEALGFSRVAAYEVLPGNKVRSVWQWRKVNGRIEEGPYSDSHFAEAQTPRTGEPMDEVLKSGGPVVVHDPQTDVRCKVRSPQTSGQFVILRSNGTIHLFDAWGNDRPIENRDIELLSSLISAGGQAKERIRSHRDGMITHAIDRMRGLFVRAEDEADLTLAFLISITFNLQANRVAIICPAAGTTFALGSLTLEDHKRAIAKIQHMRTEAEIYKLVAAVRGSVDGPINDCAWVMNIGEGIGETLIVRQGRTYRTNGEELTKKPEIIISRFSITFSSQDFVLVPLSFGKGDYGVLFLDNPWEKKDIDVEAAEKMTNAYIVACDDMRWRESQSAKREAARFKTEAETHFNNWIAASIENPAGQTLTHRKTAAGYSRLLERVRDSQMWDVSEMVRNSLHRLSMPAEAVVIDSNDSGIPALLGRWGFHLIEGALIEARRHFGYPESRINYEAGHRIVVTVGKESIRVEDNAPQFAFPYDEGQNLTPDLGERLIEAGKDGIFRDCERVVFLRYGSDTRSKKNFITIGFREGMPL